MTATRGGSPARPPMVVRFGASLAALGSVLAGKALIACGLRRPPEGWRRTVGILLRSEPTRFALSAFGLHVPEAGAPASREPVPAFVSDFGRTDPVEALAASALRIYLAAQPDAHFVLEWRKPVTIRRRSGYVDVVRLRFSADGRLESLTPHLADAGPALPSEPERAAVHQAVATAYNQTRRLPETERPRTLLRAVETACAAASGRAATAATATYARRVLSACCVSFEPVDVADPAARFRPPDFHARRTLGFGVLNVVMRLGQDLRTIDVWMSAHHVGLDGVPLQELVSGLERAWGASERVVFPAADLERPFMRARVCSGPGEREVHEILAFVDFSPVLALRQALNASHAGAAGGPITFGAVIAWLLHLEPEFAGVRIASTVDVAASGGYDRDVDVVPLRPADYATDGDPWAGFVEFAAEFNRLLALSRARTSPLRRGMQTAGLLPPVIHSHAVRSNPAAVDDTFGSLCVTIIRDAKVFVAPMTDLGLGHGFFAIGRIDLPAADGSRVGAVSIKGDAGTIAGHHAALRRAIARSATLTASLLDRGDSRRPEFEGQ